MKNRDWWKAFYFQSKDQPLPDKFNLWRKFAQDLSPKARLRLEWIIFYETVGEGNVSKTATHFGISRKTFHKWYKRFKESKERVSSLEEYSRTPIRKRSWEVTREQEYRIVNLRKKYMKYGKKKLKVLYEGEYKESISTWKIERVIRKYQLFPDKAAYQKKLKKKARLAKYPRKRITEIEESSAFGYLWHIDCIIIWWYGVRRVIFTAIEDLTKIGYARAYPTNSSGYAEDFLKRLMYLVEGKVELMHSDNGTEFDGDFRKACLILGIEQVYSRPRTPKDNPALERFNRTVQDEWLSMSKVGLDEIPDSNQDLSQWLVEYNSHRPHESLDYQTPLEYAQEHYFKEVLPMWSARTKFDRQDKNVIKDSITARFIRETSMITRRTEEDIMTDKRWADERVNVLREWIEGSDVLIQYPWHLQSLGDRLESVLNRYEKINILIYERCGPGGGGGAPPIDVYTLIGFSIIVILSKIGEGFLQKVGEDIHNFARDLFRARKQTRYAGRFAVVFDLQKIQVWYFLPNYLSENDFISAFSKIEEHVSKISFDENCYQETLEFIYDPSKKIWQLENHRKIP